MRLSSFIIGLLVVGFVISVVALLMAHIGQTSSETVGNTNFSSYDKVDRIYDQSEQIKSKVSNITSDRSGFDIVGQLVGSGVDTIKITYSSVELGIDMTDDAFGGINGSSGVPLGSTGDLLQTFLVAGIIIILFVGIILGIILRWKV